ncbi:glycerate kinase [Paenibacillus sp. p3-SID867]|uniref:glycerate kinase family protein n=1 Tax=Paenibacillus sp. p3-SID867 TaxID=2916363 RepID=UPI0021A691D1|nr:glycerate kinase [Paenibacillus sp. p3-SID867]MCT1400250.1 glycerate kinase [Paenibacillus sp. p3-SID867]
MKIVMVPSGFKECLDADEVGEAMERGVRRLHMDASITVIPMIDGGEGFARSIVNIKQGQLYHMEVTGPVGQPITSCFGVYTEHNKKTAVIEMAAAAGLKLVPRDRRNPLWTTTYGVGELIKGALDYGVDHILIGCGDSGTCDGGAGMAQALGAVFSDEAGKPVFVRGGGDLHKVQTIELAGLDPRLRDVQIDVACNWHNILCGMDGVAHVFAPQKGATEAEVEQLAGALHHYAYQIHSQLGVDITHAPGSGASGGLGAGLAAFTKAKLHPRYEIIMQYINIEEHILGADVVLTAEGCLDYQTPNGKIPSEVARIAKSKGIPVIAITGTIGENAEINYENGIDAYSSIIQTPTSLDQAIKKAALWIADSTEAALRHVRIGYQIAHRSFVEGKRP